MAVLTLPAATHWLPLFSATASAVFLVLLPYKLGQLYRASIKARSSWHGKLKAVRPFFHNTKRHELQYRL